ncbi:hypothetical protein JD292_11800 [Leucobacter sp. CSA2]|uniref:ABC transporter permease n=1 Tax=Leucobacter edaphi TaxID=2796472 RepID=A0A934QDQ7_9MICO|nr:hypothetical protein [Leucobacter edaphi]MBK0422756.1 hypothetical protein [Leucobacter edaphi]
MGALILAEATKFLTTMPVWILAVATVALQLPLAWVNAASGVGVPADSPLLYSSVPVPLAYQGFEMADLGYVIVVSLAALWAGSEYTRGKQIRTTLLATPQRARVFIVQAGLLTAFTAVLAFVTMTGTIMINHAAGLTGVDPLLLTPLIWANIGGVTLSWTLTSLIAFALGVIARSAILPLMLLVPLIVGLGSFLAGVWGGARFLPTAAGAAMYGDPGLGVYLPPVLGGVVQAGWAAALILIAGACFVRRDA